MNQRRLNIYQDTWGYKRDVLYSRIQAEIDYFWASFWARLFYRG